MTDWSSRLVLTIAIVVTGVGALDAYVGRKWDLVAVFVFLGLLLMMLWLRQRAHRVPVDLRSDLARFLEHQSQRTGEPMEDVVDRAVAAYRQGLFPDSAEGK